MKILALSDEVAGPIYSSHIKEQYGDVDLVIGCGDLPYYYLEYVVTMLMDVPVVYVYGNHDKTQYTADGRTLNAAEGCKIIDGKVHAVDDLILVGLGGSIRYQPNAIHQYTEGEMVGRILQLIPRLIFNRLTRGRFLDILVTHSPPFGIHDGKDRAHVGFKSLLTFMRYFKPRYMLHGHKHIYRRDTKRVTQYHATTVINVYPVHVLELDDNLLEVYKEDSDEWPRKSTG